MEAHQVNLKYGSYFLIFRFISKNLLIKKKVTEWNIEQVACYISKMSDNYFSSFADTFRHHVIICKAFYSQ